MLYVLLFRDAIRVVNAENRDQFTSPSNITDQILLLLTNMTLTATVLTPLFLLYKLHCGLLLKDFSVWKCSKVIIIYA